MHIYIYIASNISLVICVIENFTSYATKATVQLKTKTNKYMASEVLLISKC